MYMYWIHVCVCAHAFLSKHACEDACVAFLFLGYVFRYWPHKPYLCVAYVCSHACTVQESAMCSERVCARASLHCSVCVQDLWSDGGEVLWQAGWRGSCRGSLL